MEHRVAIIVWWVETGLVTWMMISVNSSRIYGRRRDVYFVAASCSTTGGMENIVRGLDVRYETSRITLDGYFTFVVISDSPLRSEVVRRSDARHSHSSLRTAHRIPHSFGLRARIRYKSPP